MRLLPAGPRAVLAEVGSTDEALALYAAATAAGVAAVDVVPAARTVLFDGVDDVDALGAALAALPQQPAAARSDRVVELPTVYDGPDLEAVARQWGVDVQEVVRTHTSTEFTVAFCGFAPGFAYCTGLPPGREVSRHASPRPRVPAGAVALAGPFTAVYPAASPGGWQLVGRTEQVLWDPASSAPALLTPGTRVRFREVGR